MESVQSKNLKVASFLHIDHFPPRPQFHWSSFAPAFCCSFASNTVFNKILALIQQILHLVTWLTRLKHHTATFHFLVCDVLYLFPPIFAQIFFFILLTNSGKNKKHKNCGDVKHILVPRWKHSLISDMFYFPQIVISFSDLWLQP